MQPACLLLRIVSITRALIKALLNVKAGKLQGQTDSRIPTFRSILQFLKPAKHTNLQQNLGEDTMAQQG